MLATLTLSVSDRDAVAGALSWYGFQQAGIHPALGLLPIIPAIPHADVEFGVFAEEEKNGVKEEKVLFLEKRKVGSGPFVFEVDVPEKPARAGVDPYNKWVDRDSDDNVRWAEEASS